MLSYYAKRCNKLKPWKLREKTNKHKLDKNDFEMTRINQEILNLLKYIE